jgi:hypothetical protein
MRKKKGGEELCPRWVVVKNGGSQRRGLPVMKVRVRWVGELLLSAAMALDLRMRVGKR